MFWEVWDYSNSKQKANQYKQKTLLENYKIENKILAIPRLV